MSTELYNPEVRLSSKQRPLLDAALLNYGRAHQSTRPAEARKAAMLLARVRRMALPYRINISQHEWETISRALRVGGNLPQAGSIEARWLGLYRFFKLRYNFGPVTRIDVGIPKGPRAALGQRRVRPR